MMNNTAANYIEIYTRPGCGYSAFAKHLLNSKKLAFTEYDVYQQPHRVTEMQSRTQGRTYPQVFINNLPVGGYEELLVLEQQNRLPSTSF